ncbi:MAG TPA: DUF2948 family protein [Propylenella sp.]
MMDGLRLIALDAEDLAVLSAYVQDAVLKVRDINWMPAERRLVMAMNRFAWEAALGRSRRRDYQRRRSALRFDRVAAVSSTGIDRAAGDAVLELLAVRFEPRRSPSGDVMLDFAGGAALRLSVECLEAQLTDLGPVWSTPHAPRHIVA